MAGDNILGGDANINVPLGIDIQLGGAVQDASALANQFKDLLNDGQALNNILSDTSERMKEITQSTTQQSTVAQQLIGFEQELRDISESRLSSARDITEQYEKLEQIMGRIQIIAENTGGIGGPGGGRGAELNGPSQNSGRYYQQQLFGLGQFGGFANRVGTGYYGPQYSSGGIDSGYDQGLEGENDAKILGYSRKEQQGERGGGGGEGGTAGSLFLLEQIGKLADKRTGGGGSGPSKGFAGGLSNVAPELGVLAALPFIAGKLKSLGTGLYNDISSPFVTAQEYSGLTGGTGVAQGQYYDIANKIEGLNPLIGKSYAESRALGLGQFGANSPLTGQYINFAYGAKSQYNIDPQESMQMFLTSVVQAGGSVAQLSSSLAQLADTALKSGGSFQELVKNASNITSTFASLGSKGNAANELGTLLASAAPNALGKTHPDIAKLLSGFDLSSIQNTPGGQEALAKAIGNGTTYQNLPSVLGKLTGAQTAQDVFKAYSQIISQAGFTPGAPISPTEQRTLSLKFAGYGMSVNPQIAGYLAQYLPELENSQQIALKTSPGETSLQYSARNKDISNFEDLISSNGIGNYSVKTSTGSTNLQSLLGQMTPTNLAKFWAQAANNQQEFREGTSGKFESIYQELGVQSPVATQYNANQATQLIKIDLTPRAAKHFTVSKTPKNQK